MKYFYIYLLFYFVSTDTLASMSLQELDPGTDAFVTTEDLRVAIDQQDTPRGWSNFNRTVRRFIDQRQDMRNVTPREEAFLTESLFLSIIDQNRDMVRDLIEFGVDIESYGCYEVDRLCGTPLAIASYKYERRASNMIDVLTSIMWYLIGQNADINGLHPPHDPAYQTGTPLTLALMAENVPAVDILVRLGGIYDGSMIEVQNITKPVIQYILRVRATQHRPIRYTHPNHRE